MKRKIVFLRVLVVIIIVSSIIGCQSITLQQLEVTEQQEKEVEESSSENEAVFEIRMLDVGQGEIKWIRRRLLGRNLQQ